MDHTTGITQTLWVPDAVETYWTGRPRGWNPALGAELAAILAAHGGTSANITDPVVRDRVQYLSWAQYCPDVRSVEPSTVPPTPEEIAAKAADDAAKRQAEIDGYTLLNTKGTINK